MIYLKVIHKIQENKQQREIQVKPKIKERNGINKTTKTKERKMINQKTRIKELINLETIKILSKIKILKIETNTQASHAEKQQYKKTSSVLYKF